MNLCSEHLTSSSQIIMFCFNHMIQRIISIDKSERKKSIAIDSGKGVLMTFLADTLQVFGNVFWPVAELVLLSFSRIAVKFHSLILD